jgi:dolichol-phosphate mannosyltransferase
MAPKISAVIPVYQARECVAPLCDRLMKALSSIDPGYEIILVDDRSTDGSWEELRAAAGRHPQVKVARLSRNFGQHQAITAGLSLSKGAWVCVMDCDLQHPPEAIPQMFAKAQEGHDIVYAKQTRYHTGFFKGLASGFYHWVIGLLANVSTRDLQGRFTLMSRKVADEFMKLQDYYRDYLVLLKWMGFDIASIEVEGHPRYRGKSAYTWRKLLAHAVDGIISQSNALLKFSTYTGFVSAFGAVVFAVWIVWNRLKHPAVPLGWSSLMATILFFGGVILISLGIIGIYIEKIFFQTKQRPIFIIDQQKNF